MPPAYGDNTRPSRIGWPLPPFYWPYARDLIHPKAAELEERSIAWIDAFGLYPDATERAWGLATRSADMVSRIVPFGEVEPMLLFSQWCYWAFAADDWQDSGTGPARTAAVADHGARMIRTLEVPGAGLLPPGPYTAALDDLVARTREMLTREQLHRLTEGLRDWILGAAARTAAEEQGVMPGLNDFAATRVSVGATRFLLTWCDVANGIHVPGEVLYSAPVQALTDAAGFIVACDNDVFSYDKDDHQEPLEQNLVNVLALHHGCTAAEALPAVYALRDRSVTLFARLREQLARGADDQLARHLDSVEHWVSGDTAYHDGALRYASPRNRNALPVEGASFDIAWSDAPSDPSLEPLPIPALAWWWQQLDASSR
ncbi:terpene synthase family protein [Streptomyces sp. NBC_01343]|uniref:terpene synthase family protein n=1 Tax=Streptomyces sp. NBC_01343 TaxID=2903832 RepID=UPI002E162087|nr:terpene synthase family protein [Streptomyces sp. NBC_01343]